MFEVDHPIPVAGGEFGDDPVGGGFVEVEAAGLAVDGVLLFAVLQQHEFHRRGAGVVVGHCANLSFFFAIFPKNGLIFFRFWDKFNRRNGFQFGAGGE